MASYPEKLHWTKLIMHYIYSEENVLLKAIDWAINTS